MTNVVVMAPDVVHLGCVNAAQVVVPRFAHLVMARVKAQTATQALPLLVINPSTTEWIETRLSRVSATSDFPVFISKTNLRFRPIFARIFWVFVDSAMMEVKK